MNQTPPSDSDENSIVRPVQVDDLALVGDLLDDVFRRSRGVFDQSQLTDFPLVLGPQNLVNNRLIVEDGLVVSHAALWPRELECDGQRFKVAIIASVATNPKYRNRGYAAKLMRSLQQLLHEQSYDCAILWTSVPDFYVKLGWRLVTPRGVMTEVTKTFGERAPSGLHKCLPFDTQSHLETVLEIYDRNPVRLLRDRYQAERLFSLPKVPVWVATRDGQVVAYVCHGQAINKQGITEYGGEIEGIVALIGHIARSLEDGRVLPLLIYHSRLDLAERARELGLPEHPLQSSKGTNHEMVYDVRPGGLPRDVCDRLFVWGLDHA
jgi:predicted N-acetyltransferase YhbS